MPRRPNMEQSFNNVFPVVKGESDLTGFKLVEHAYIKVEAQPRTVFSIEELEDLANNIHELHQSGEGIEGTGIFLPLTVVQLEDEEIANDEIEAEDEANTVSEATADTSKKPRYRYLLISGERRYRASLKAGVPQIPVIVSSSQASTQGNSIFLAQIIENLQRQDLPPLDEAKALQHLMEEQSLSVRDTATLLGKSKSYLTDRIALLKMAPDVQVMVSQRADSLFHAREIQRIKDKQTRQLLINATLEGISVSELRRRIDQINPMKSNASAKASTKASPDHSAQSNANQNVIDQTRPSLQEEIEQGEIEATATDRAEHEQSEHEVSVHPDTTPSSISVHHSSTLVHSHSSINPVLQLKPAAGLLAEAVRILLDNPGLADDFRNDIETELNVLEEQIAQLKNAL